MSGLLCLDLIERGLGLGDGGLIALSLGLDQLASGLHLANRQQVEIVRVFEGARLNTV